MPGGEWGRQFMPLRCCRNPVRDQQLGDERHEQRLNDNEDKGITESGKPEQFILEDDFDDEGALVTLDDLPSVNFSRKLCF